MSLLPSATFASLNDPYYTRSAGSGSTLNSPVLVNSSGAAALRITCDPTGHVSIGPNGGGDPSVSMELSNDADVNPAVLSIKTNPGTNAGYIFVGNPVGGSTISIAGNAAAGACVIQGGNACTGIDIGANNVNYDNIAITPNVTKIKGLGGAPQTLLATQTIVAGGQVDVALPTGEGLYAIVGCADPAATPTAYTRQAQLSSTCYINSAGVCNMGGSAFADTGAIGSTDAAYLEVNPTGTGLILYNSAAQGLVGYTVKAFQLSGPIGGTL